jgi:hypothetical protein
LREYNLLATIGGKKKEARSTTLRACRFPTANSRKPKNQTPPFYHSFRLSATAGGLGSKTPLSPWYVRSTVVAAVGIFSSVKAAGEVRGTVARNAAGRHSTTPVVKPNASTVGRKRAKRRTGRRRNAAGWDWRKKSNESWTIRVQAPPVAVLHSSHHPEGTMSGGTKGKKTFCGRWVAASSAAHGGSSWIDFPAEAMGRRVPSSPIDVARLRHRGGTARG